MGRTYCAQYIAAKDSIARFQTASDWARYATDSCEHCSSAALGCSWMNDCRDGMRCSIWHKCIARSCLVPCSSGACEVQVPRHSLGFMQ